MGDNETNQPKPPTTAEPDSDSGSSLKALHSVKPSANIAITDEPPSKPSVEKVETVHEKVIEPASLPSVVESEAKVETFFEKPLEPSHSENKKLIEKIEVKSEVAESEAEIKTEQLAVEDPPKPTEYPSKEKPQPINLDKKPRVSSATSGLMHGERIFRNQSDIFSLKEQTSVSSAIFSINGSPSRKVFRRKEAIASNVFPFGQEEPPSEKAPTPTTMPREKLKDTKESYNELTRPSGSLRNPLTGTGLSSNDEYKFKGTKRRDGNPLLGLGYSPEVTPSAHRIPPGGFSHKLW